MVVTVEAGRLLSALRLVDGTSLGSMQAMAAVARMAAAVSLSRYACGSKKGMALA